MPVSADYRELVEDRLGAAVPSLKTRSMFGGVGIYSAAHFFALIADDVLYFKVNNESRLDFEELRMGPFCPFGDPKAVMQYYRVPDAVFDDLAQLRAWAAKAISVAKSKSPGRKRRGKKG